ncbi:MAG: Asp-tRNA(Asn)/Glu-tRNA(Gln) amidotransferase subunit GatA [Pyrodictiaceae archaeon]
MKPYKLSAIELRRALVSGDIDPEDYVYSIYERINRLEGRLNAFITLREVDKVLQDVKERVREARKEKGKPLAGILVAVKDNISTRGLRTTCASRILEKYIPPFNATVVDKLIEAGAVIIGKTNMDEFAMGSTGETSAYGPTRNPWAPQRVPGGSSSGSAAALAAGLATLALGSDTGGSIRLPASWTGIYGLKPTYGAVSRYGLIAYAESLEQIGPMARSIDDLKLLYDVIAGWDPRDSTTMPQRGEKRKTVRNIAVIEDFIDHPLIEEVVKNAIKYATRIFERNGLVVEYTSLGRKLVDYALPAYYVIAMAEASSNLARYDCIRYGCKERIKPWESWNKYYSRLRGKLLGSEVKKRIMLGSWLLSAGFRDQYYIRALKIRRVIRDSLLALLKNHDILLLPSAVSEPPFLGQMFSEDPLKLYMLDLATVIANLAGVPALTVPIIWGSETPLGVQLVSSYWQEYMLFEAARLLEEEAKMRDLIAA